jgi:hypothetical protein
MGIFDAVDEDKIEFDEESKIRLFETQQRSSRSIHDHLKRFLPMAVVAAVVVGGIIYMMQPGVGSPIAVQDEMKQAVYDHMLTKEKRTLAETTYYKCDGYTWVKVVAEPRSYPPSLPLDAVNQYRLKVDSAGEKLFNIETLPLPAKQDDVPCK